MPRAKKPHGKPLYTFSFRDHKQRKCIAEVWEKFSESGGRGVHNGRSFDILFDYAFEDLTEQMFFNQDPKVQREAWRLFSGPVSRHATEHVLSVARRKGVVAKEALRRRVAKAVRLSIQAALNANPSMNRYKPIPK